MGPLRPDDAKTQSRPHRRKFLCGRLFSCAKAFSSAAGGPRHKLLRQTSEKRSAQGRAVFRSAPFVLRKPSAPPPEARVTNFRFKHRRSGVRRGGQSSAVRLLSFESLQLRRRRPAPQAFASSTGEAECAGAGRLPQCAFCPSKAFGSAAGGSRHKLSLQASAGQGAKKHAQKPAGAFPAKRRPVYGCRGGRCGKRNFRCVSSPAGKGADSTGADGYGSASCRCSQHRISSVSPVSRSV